MSKAILISIKPKYVAKILNGEKTIEIRKKFLKDYVGWVYIYVTKGKPYITGIYNYEHKVVYGDIENKNHNINGKIVARFWCDKVEETHIYAKNHEDNALLKNSCLTVNEFMNYLGNKPYGKAIPITKLEIFDKPKEISEFKKPMEYTKHCNRNCFNCDYAGFNNKTQKWEFECSITRAPESYCYVEV